MADETPTPAPFSEDALASRIRTEVRGALSDLAQNAQQQQAQAQQQQRAQQYAAQARQDPIQSQVIEPYVAPAMRAVALQSQAAMDAVLFYNRHPEARRYQDEIEHDFGLTMQRGTPFDRETVYRHWIGANVDRYQQDRQEELQRTAAAGATLGAPGVGRAPNQPALDAQAAQNLSLEDLERAVKSRMF